jgi:F-type H+-transporting ATPase subunit gamma
VVRRLLPLPRPEHEARGELPLTNEAPAAVALGVAQHFVYHTLLAVLLAALKEENHLRLVQMENAQQHIERASADLKRSRDQLRQEEIIEELELIEQRDLPA